MNQKLSHRSSQARRRTVRLAVVCFTGIVVAGGGSYAQEADQAPVAAAEVPQVSEETAPALTPDQLDSLVAPVALYPDPLLAQALVASTYPLEVVQLQQWLAKNPDLEGEALTEAVAKQPWDPSIQSMAAVPEVVKRLADDIQWTADLGNAFLSQQSGVMDAVQRMRKKAQDNGALGSNEHQKVETQVIEEKTVIVVEPSDPEVIYVPSYSPTVVYGPPVYPYPPIYYPTYPPGAAFVSFSFGFMWGAAWGGSCCGCGWGGNDIDINIDNNFNRANNIQGGDRINAGGGKWQHDPQHRGGAPYADRATANKYGGTTRGDSRSGRQASARQTGGRTGGAGVSDRAGSARSPSAGVSNRAAGSGDRRASAPGATSSRGGSDRIGSRSIPSSSGRSRASAYGGSRGYSGSRARASSARGASSMGSMRSRGGGMRRR